MKDNTAWTHAKRNDPSYIALAEDEAKIGDGVVIQPGVCGPLGSITIDGRASMGSGCVNPPWAHVGPRPYETQGPTIAPGVFIGAHATVRGPISVGPDAQLGAGAVIDVDVPSGATVAGGPARIIETGAPSRLDRARQDEQAQ